MVPGVSEEGGRPAVLKLEKGLPDPWPAGLTPVHYEHGGAEVEQEHGDEGRQCVDVCEQIIDYPHCADDCDHTAPE